jgi:hypothetical protein
MDNVTAWALSKAQDIVECEGSALTTCVRTLNINDLEADTTLLAMAISDALLEAYSLGALAPNNAPGGHEIEAELLGA